VRTTFLVGVVILMWPQSASTDTWVLQGTLLTPDRVIEDGIVVVSDQRISAVGVSAKSSVAMRGLDALR